jgi:ubiquinone/menaquinone biosynthesis C-methylase UbiE
MKESGFDAFAQSYDSEHRRSIAFSGCEPSYFARYKVEIAASCFRSLCGECETLLDFGCGPGTSIPYFRMALASARILAADISRLSLMEAEARHGPAASYLPIEGSSLEIEDGEVGLGFAACVFHHIPPAEHQAWLKELRRVIKPGGGLIIFEHNQLNPLTRHAVANCAFDHDAILLRAGTLRRSLEDAGWRVLRIRYHVFFPQVLKALRAIEPALGRIPLGGQYSVLSIKA